MPPSPAPLTLQDLGSFLGQNLQLPYFDVTDRRFGAKGDGVADDTAAFQAAFNAAVAVNGTVKIPKPSAQYVISDTITVGTLGGAQVRCHVIADGGPTFAILYTGTGGKPIFAINELQDSVWQGLRVQLPNASAIAGCIFFEVNGASTAQNTFVNCHSRDSSSSTGTIFWRFAHDAASNNVSFFNFITCTVSGHASDTTSVGWTLERANIKNMCWYGCATSQTGTAYTNALGPSQGTDFYWFGCGGSSNQLDFSLSGGGLFGIYGGRYETGKRFLQTAVASSHLCFVVDGVKIATYTPADGVVFKLQNKPHVGSITNVQIIGTDMTSACLQFENQAAGGAGVLRVHGVVQAAAAGTQVASVVSSASGEYDIDWHVQLCNGSSQSRGLAPAPDSPSTLTYGATVNTNAARKGPYKITATNGTAFTIAAPTNPSSKTITYDILNSSGGAMGVVTWDAAFKLDATGFVNPANTKRKTITFYWDNTNWVQVGPTSADI